MRWMNYHLNAEGRQRVEAAVRAAERETAGELVPVLARRSAGHRHVPWLVAALVFGALSVSGLIRGGFLLPWGSRWQGALNVALSLGLAGILGAGLGRLAWVRRALTPAKDRRAAAHRAAELAFHRLGLHQARHDAGVLLFVSLEERQAVVLAGPGIHALAGPGHWEDVCASLLRGAARRDLASGFEAAIAQAGAQLARSFPRQAHEDDPQLPDRLRILHDAP